MLNENKNMTNIFEVLELISLFLNIASLVVICIGWLTCADYYYKLNDYQDGLPLFMHMMFSLAISIASIVIGLSFNGIGNAPYVNLSYISGLIFIIIAVFVCNKIIDLRQYFANKRGRL